MLDSLPAISSTKEYSEDCLINSYEGFVIVTTFT